MKSTVWSIRRVLLNYSITFSSDGYNLAFAFYSALGDTNPKNSHDFKIYQVGGHDGKSIKNTSAVSNPRQPNRTDKKSLMTPENIRKTSNAKSKAITELHQ